MPSWNIADHRHRGVFALTLRCSLLLLATVACDSLPGTLAPQQSEGSFAIGPLLPADESRCTQADAQSIFHNWSGTVWHGLRGEVPSRPAARFGECQYRLYLDGEMFTFAQGDVILGGVNVFWEFEILDALGMTREEAIADLEATEERVWLARVQADGTVGELIEQPLSRTPYRDGTYPEIGRVVQQHRAFVTSLPAGEYLSLFWARWEAFPGLPAGELNATVRLLITP